jgi:hypothetical protein
MERLFENGFRVSANRWRVLLMTKQKWEISWHPPFELWRKDCAAGLCAYSMRRMPAVAWGLSEDGQLIGLFTRAPVARHRLPRTPHYVPFFLQIFFAFCLPISGNFIISQPDDLLFPLCVFFFLTICIFPSPPLSVNSFFLLPMHLSYPPPFYVPLFLPIYQPLTCLSFPYLCTFFLPSHLYFHYLFICHFLLCISNNGDTNLICHMWK